MSRIVLRLNMREDFKWIRAKVKQPLKGFSFLFVCCVCCHYLFSYLLLLLSGGFSFFLCIDYFFSLGSRYTMQSNVKCKIISLNVRGIRDQTKRRSIFTYLKDQKADFYFLQETCSDANDESMWQSEWG